MTLQRICLHAVALATLGAMCLAQSGTQSTGSGMGTESTRQQVGSQQPVEQQQPTSQQVPQTGTAQYGQSGTSAPASMSDRTAMQGSTAPAMSNTGKSPDHLFITKAAQGGLAEVELGNLAQQKAKSDDVKQFGSRMSADHSQANNELQQLAAQKGIAVPSSIAAKDKETKKMLSAKSGANFDKAYMRDMVKDHEKDVAEFRKEAENGKDPDVKAFAQKTLPTLEEHLAQAKEVASKVGAGVTAQKKTGAGNMQEKPGAMAKPSATSPHQY